MTWDDGLARSWMTLAACHQLPPEIFFPANDKTIHPDVADACAVCQVREPCLEYALATRSAGIWGGLTEDQRRSLHRRELRRARETEEVA